jgi:hypothetical protein
LLRIYHRGAIAEQLADAAIRDKFCFGKTATAGLALQKYFGEPCNVINFSARNTFRRSNCHAFLARQ